MLAVRGVGGWQAQCDSLIKDFDKISGKRQAEMEAGRKGAHCGRSRTMFAARASFPECLRTHCRNTGAKRCTSCNF